MGKFSLWHCIVFVRSVDLLFNTQWNFCGLQFSVGFWKANENRQTVVSASKSPLTMTYWIGQQNDITICWKVSLQLFDHPQATENLLKMKGSGFFGWNWAHVFIFYFYVMKPLIYFTKTLFRLSRLHAETKAKWTYHYHWGWLYPEGPFVCISREL